MKIFAGSWFAVKSGFVGLIIGGVILATDALVGLEWMPNRTMSIAFAGIIILEWISRFARRAVEGYHSEGAFFSTFLQAFFENIGVTFFYLLTATGVHLFAIMFSHRSGTLFAVAAQTIKGAVFFALALMSLTFIIVNLRGEHGAKLFFERMTSILKAPGDNADAFVEDEGGKG